MFSAAINTKQYAQGHRCPLGVALATLDAFFVAWQRRKELYILWIHLKGSVIPHDELIVQAIDVRNIYSMLNETRLEAESVDDDTGRLDGELSRRCRKVILFIVARRRSFIFEQLVIETGASHEIMQDGARWRK